MRTTIRINDQLLAEAKKIAAERGTTLTAVVEDSLRETLARRGQPRARRRSHLPTSGRGGLQPNVGLNNSAALLDLMEGRDGVGGR